MGIWTATSDDYLRTLQGLLPRGILWTRDAGSRLTKLLHGLADEFARAHNAAGNVMEEADPQTASSASLPDHERVWGLPEFGYAPTSDADRQAALLAKWRVSPGGQTATYFHALAVTLGCADATIYDGPFPFVFTVSLPAEIKRMKAGQRCGQQIRVDLTDLTRVRGYLEAYKPGHTAIWWIGS